MSIAISTSAGVKAEAASTVSSAVSNTASNIKTEPKAQPVLIPPDPVNLTETQQVYQLYNQGQRVTQIASNLNLSVEAVNSYLNISNGTG